MKSGLFVAIGIALLFALSVFTTIVMPYMDLLTVPPTAGARPYTALEEKGRMIYRREGCYYCHTMQVRRVPDTDAEGRLKRDAKGQIIYKPLPADVVFSDIGGGPSEPGDYCYDKPHLLGTERTGPDLFYEGTKRPQKQFHVDHFKDPQSVEPRSLMPSFDFLTDDELDALIAFVIMPRGRAVGGAKKGGGLL
jgi:cbb3-type cytochrome oxidase cytochrome c subunit